MNKIFDFKTGMFVNVLSSKGKKILRRYIKLLQYSGSIDNNNPSKSPPNNNESNIYKILHPKMSFNNSLKKPPSLVTAKGKRLLKDYIRQYKHRESQ